MSQNAKRQIVLDNGQRVEGQVVPLNWARFLVQGDDFCLQLEEDEIRSIDGESNVRQAADAPPVELCQTSYFHEVRADGGGTDWVWSSEIHHGTEPKTEQSFAFGRSDRPLNSEERRELGTVVESMEYHDKWGRPLPTLVEEENDMGWKLNVLFDEPVLPGQSVELVHKKIWPRWSRKDQDGWVRRHFIRPSVGTLTTISMRLPAGATFSRVEPKPLWSRVLNGHQSLGWRRYIDREESFMPVVRYNLADAAKGTATPS